MLNCDLCDYFQPTEKAGVTKCDFTDVVFTKNIEELDMEYPCRHVSYESYLERRGESPERVNELQNDDWRYLYLKGHEKPAGERLRGLV